MNVLFVCTGNTCRSPMAEKILKKRVIEEKIDMNITSAGISTIEGQAASKHAEKIMRNYGESEHSAKRITQDLIEWADLILTMTIEHQRYLISNNKEFKDKIFTLKEFSKINKDEKKLYLQFEAKKQDFHKKNKKVIGDLRELQKLERELYLLNISDPFGGSYEDYKYTAKEIEKAVEELLKKINQEY